MESNPEIDRQIESARRHQRTGDLTGAEKIYREVLARRPGDARTLHRLATLLGQQGKLEEAAELAGRAIEINPDDPDAHKTMAAVRASKGDIDGAGESYRAVLKLRPGDAMAHRNLGAMLALGGRLEEAAVELGRATELNPNDFWAFYELGNVQVRQNHFDEAQSALLRAIALKSDFAAAHISLAEVHRVSGRGEESIASYRRALQFKPDSVEALSGLARVYDWLGRFEDALASYAKAAAAKPDFYEAHARMAVMLAALQRFEEALACQARAAALNPDAALTHYAMAEILLHRRDEASAREAVRCFRAALAVNPALVSAWNDLGLVLRSMGEFDEAANCFRKVLEMQPNSPAAHYNLAGTGAIKSEQEIQQLAEALNQTNLTDEQRVGMEFALASVLDDAQRFEEAFALFAKANASEKRLREATGDTYDPAASHQQISDLIETFSASFFALRRDWGDETELPVFVVGMPRSGTTLVQQIAAGHPQIHGAGEMWAIRRIAESWSPSDGRMAPIAWTREAIKGAAAQHLRHLRELDGSALRIIDKTPSNILYLGMVALMFPGAGGDLPARSAGHMPVLLFPALPDRQHIFV